MGRLFFVKSLITSFYHHARFKVYHSGAELRNYLLFHRELIRILRASFFNFGMIALALILNICLNCPVNGMLLICIHVMCLVFMAAFLLVWQGKQVDFYLTIIRSLRIIQADNNSTQQ